MLSPGPFPQAGEGTACCFTGVPPKVDGFLDPARTRT